jgi:release factor glutamine methyltransferase
MIIVKDLLREGVEELNLVGISHADIDVQLLLGHCLGKSRTELFLAAKDLVHDSNVVEFRRLLGRRKKREPVAYLLQEREFWSLPFYVNGSVLIPRPETEFLLETVFEHVRRPVSERSTILDLCCGSGVIAVVLALELDNRVVASDYSMSALNIAKHNSQRHGVGSLVDFVCCDLLAPFSSENQFSLIVSNPPYVTSADIPELEPDVKEYEPHLALDGGDDGLHLIRRIYGYLKYCLKPGGFFFMEFGEEQGKAIYKLFSTTRIEDYSFECVEIVKDYSGRDRVLIAKRKS